MFTLTVEYLSDDLAPRNSEGEALAVPCYASIDCPEGYGWMDVENGDSLAEIASFVRSLEADFDACPHGEVRKLGEDSYEYVWGDESLSRKATIIG